MRIRMGPFARLREKERGRKRKKAGFRVRTAGNERSPARSPGRVWAEIWRTKGEARSAESLDEAEAWAIVQNKAEIKGPECDQMSKWISGLAICPNEIRPSLEQPNFGSDLATATLKFVRILT
jgi:hypothetical protein